MIALHGWHHNRLVEDRLEVDFTTMLAVYAAVLATYREVQSRQQWKPNLKVRLSFSIVLIGPRGTVPQAQIWIENHGRSDILFNSNGVSIAAKGCDGAWLIADPISNVTFPHTLKPGGSFYFMKERAPVLEALRGVHPGEVSVEMRAVVSDAITRPFYSDWQDVPLAEKDEPQH